MASVMRGNASAPKPQKKSKLSSFFSSPIVPEDNLKARDEYYDHMVRERKSREENDRVAAELAEMERNAKREEPPQEKPKDPEPDDWDDAATYETENKTNYNDESSSTNDMVDALNGLEVPKEQFVSTNFFADEEDALDIVDDQELIKLVADMGSLDWSSLDQEDQVGLWNNCVKIYCWMKYKCDFKE